MDGAGANADAAREQPRIPQSKAKAQAERVAPGWARAGVVAGA